ncbi:MAG: general secretion pathway protein GspK, partial [Planctomycetes bacterium]|nr:general secretion pathway protein GspK [Planctomycetota bacterium]
DSGGDPLAGGGAGGGDPFGDVTGEGGGGEDSRSAPADSVGPEEDWANFDKLTYAGEIEVSVRLIDEDRKFNVLQLATEDEDARKAAKERFIRLLDTFREDSKHDLSVSEATEIAEGMEAWLKGDRPDDFPKPKQPVKVDEEGKEIEEEEGTPKTYFPLGLEEFIGIPVLTDFMLHGYLDDDGRRYVPGIEDVATVFSSQTYDDSAVPKSEEDEEFKNPFDASSKDDPKNEGDGSGDANADGGDDGGDDAGDGEGDGEGEDGGSGTGGEGDTAATNEGRINVNTAPLVVLRSLLPNDEMPWSVLEKIDEFRRKAFEEQTGSAQDLFDKNKKKGDKDDEAGGTGDDEDEEEEEDFVFHSAEEVIDKVEKHFETNFDLTDETKTKFTTLLATKSHVFSVVIGLRDTKDVQNQSSLFRKTEGQVYNRLYRAVLWRRQDADGKFKAITLSPLTRYTGVLPPDSEEYKEEYPFGF